MALRGSWHKLVRGLGRTRESLGDRLRSAIRSGEPLDEATLEELEIALLSADLGPALTDQVIEAVRRGGAGTGGAREAVAAALRDALPEPEPPHAPPGGPRVVFVVGVNGSGKTTTVGKLAAREKREGRVPLVVAADTFRAAAVDQLERWCERAGAELIKQREGADAAAVVFDALRAGLARGVDTILVDTAGRLHTKTNLMAELGKLSRVAARQIEDAPHESLLVVDATTGQNGLSQAREFTRASTLTGVVLTKLDGTAKGGVALAIHRELGLPIRYVGVGEGIDDLLEFDREAFIAGLIEDAA